MIEVVSLVRAWKEIIWDVYCKAFKENQKKQQAWKEIILKLNEDGEPYSIVFLWLSLLM